ncbi:MAG: hypothetical protein JO257_17795 [Deltaproteobacteria bacterium]|nr:hypothetical protein [Deltaproteobacteria bacterium]
MRVVVTLRRLRDLERALELLAGLVVLLELAELAADVRERGQQRDVVLAVRRLPHRECLPVVVERLVRVLLVGVE